MRAVVVGCGAIGSDYDADAAQDAAPRSHAGAYSSSNRTDLVAGVDPDPVARERFTRRWDVPSFASFEEAAASAAPDLVSVCTPPETREEVLDEILAHPVRAIWMEKPLAATVAAGECIVEACTAAGVAVQMNFLRRFDPMHRRVAELVRGRVLSASFRFSGTLANAGSHAVDLFRWYVGDPVRVTYREETRLGVVTADGREGAFMQLPSTRLPLFDCDFWLDEARVTLTAFGEQLLVATPAQSTLFAHLRRYEYGSPDPQKGLEYAMAEGLDALVDHLERGAAIECDATDGLADLRIRAGAVG